MANATRPQPATVSDDEWESWRAYRVMNRQLERALEDRLQSDAGISTADYGILLALRNPRTTGCAPARSHGRSPGRRAGSRTSSGGWSFAG